MALIPLEEAQAFVLGRVRTLDPQSVPNANADGLVLAEPVRTDEDVPPFANTAMDGYAVRAADTDGASADAPVRLPVVAEVAAGHPASQALAAGEAMRIFTGAPLPDGADAVVMVERTRAPRRRRLGRDRGTRRRRRPRAPGRRRHGRRRRGLRRGRRGHGWSHRRARQHRALRRARGAPTPCGSPLDRRRAGRGLGAAATGPDPRLQPQRLARSGG